jgi:hypothetical protein
MTHFFDIDDELISRELFADIRSGHMKPRNNIERAEPYKSWQRGLNEHTNGLIREYIPKKTKFDTISNQFIIQIQEKLNHRPRKILSYKTPHEVFFGKIAQWIDDSKLHYKNNCVALDC